MLDFKMNPFRMSHRQHGYYPIPAGAVGDVDYYGIECHLEPWPPHKRWEEAITWQTFQEYKAGYKAIECPLTWNTGFPD